MRVTVTDMAILVPARLLPFLAVVGALTIVPGPDMALAMRNALRGGSIAAWYTGLGCCTGLALWAATAVGGLAALLNASGAALGVLRMAGAAYLALLGLRALRAAARDAPPGSRDVPEERCAAGDSATTSPSRTSEGSPRAGARPGAGRAATSRRAAYVQGLVSNLLNPKIALLFVSLLPQFVAPGEPRTATTAALAVAFLTVAMAWWTLFSLAVGFVGRALARRSVRRGVEALAGTALLGLAARVAIR